MRMLCAVLFTGLVLTVGCGDEVEGPSVPATPTGPGVWLRATVPDGLAPTRIELRLIETDLNSAFGCEADLGVATDRPQQACYVTWPLPEGTWVHQQADTARYASFDAFGYALSETADAQGRREVLAAGCVRLPVDGEATLSATLELSAPVELEPRVSLEGSLDLCLP